MVNAGALAGILRRPFVRDVGILQLGALAALGFNFALSVALARTLGRNDYGSYALVVSTMTTISLLKRLGQDYVATTDLASAYTRRDAGASRQALVAFNVVNFWSTVAVIPPSLLLASWITAWLYGNAALGEPLRLALLPPIWAMPFATVIIALQCARRVGSLTVLENANNLALGLFGLLGALVAGVSGVFWGQALASALFAAISLATYRWLRAREPLLPRAAQIVSGTLRAGLAIGRELRSGLAVALDKNLVSLYPLLPILLLGTLAPTSQVALLRVAMSYLALPLLALSAISRLLMVKFPELAETQPERARPFFLQVTAAGGGISILLTVPFVVVAPWLIDLIYGVDFAEASALVPLLALDPLLAGFGIAAGPIFRTYRRNLWAVWANLAVLAAGLPLAFLLIQSQGLAGAAIAYAGLVTCLRAVAYLLCLRILSRCAC